MLEAIRFINCQSFEDVTIDFATDKANILVAENNTGKSILFKMLKVTASPNYYTPKKRTQLIRRGATNATMVCGFTDGSIGMTVIYPNTVIYRFKMVDEEQFTNYVEPPLVYLKALGLIVDERTKFIANIVDTDQDMLLVNSDQKGNNELISLLATNSTIQEIKDKLSNLIRTHRQYNSELMLKQSNLKQVLSTLETEDVSQLEFSYKVSQLLYEILMIFDDIEKQLNIVEGFCSDVFNYNNILDTLDTYLLLNKISECLDKVDASETIDDSILKMINQYVEIVDTLSTIRAVSGKVIDIDSINHFIKIVELMNNLNALPEMIDTSDIECAILCKQILSRLITIQKGYQEFYFIESDCNKLLSIIATLGKNIKCPVHGEVIYNGKECIPYNI